MEIKGALGCIKNFIYFFFTRSHIDTVEPKQKTKELTFSKVNIVNRIHGLKGGMFLSGKMMR